MSCAASARIGVLPAIFGERGESSADVMLAWLSATELVLPLLTSTGSRSDTECFTDLSPYGKQKRMMIIAGVERGDQCEPLGHF